MPDTHLGDIRDTNSRVVSVTKVSVAASGGQSGRCRHNHAPYAAMSAEPVVGQPLRPATHEREADERRQGHGVEAGTAVGMVVVASSFSR